MGTTEETIFNATVSGCVDGRTTRAHNVALIDAAVDEIAWKCNVIPKDQETVYDMIRIPGPSPLVTASSVERQPFERDALLHWARIMVDAHKGEMHILTAHTGGCAMEFGADLHDPIRTYKNLLDAAKFLQTMFTELFGNGSIPCEVNVATQVWHVSDGRISHIENFFIEELEVYVSERI